MGLSKCSTAGGSHSSHPESRMTPHTGECADPVAKRGSDWPWEDDDMTRDLVRELQSGSSHDTRAFLKPIFKWMKSGVRKNGQKNEELVEKTFVFVDWMMQLSVEGDASRSIPVLDKLQPSYALNTIVTTSQRAGSLAEAKRAFDLTVQYGFEPDVFTYTALIDVTARSGDVREAIKIYEAMRSSRSRPNIVSFTTIIRAVGFANDVPTLECLRFLSHARQEETFDEALYLDALDTCAVRKDMEAAKTVLKDLADHDVTLRNSERLVRAIAKLVEKRDDKQTLLDDWLAAGLITKDEVEQLETTGAKTQTNGGHKSLGCLGNQTSDTVRLAVVNHDINRLVERLVNGSTVTTTDFETLIHQCRKRKWKEEVELIVNAMRKLATEGWVADDTEAILLSPQPHLTPTSKTYVSVVDAYLASGDEALAWKAFLEVGERGLVREQALYRKYVRGCYLLNDCSHIQEMLKIALADDAIVFTNRICVELARMHGYRHQDGIDVVLNQLPLANEDKRQTAMEELITSCAYKHNTQGVIDTIRALESRGLQRSAKTDTAVFICCLQHEQFAEAEKMLHDFQDKRLLLDIPMYDSLLREIYFKYTRRGSTFDESSRATAMRTLQMRRALFESAFKDREALDEWTQSKYHLNFKDKSRRVAGTESDAAIEMPCPMKYWCQVHSLECAPLMFTQHVVEVITTIRDKESKLAKQQLILDALYSTPDPFLFNLRAVVALRDLDLTYRGQGKLAKQMLSILKTEDVQTHHLDFCLDQLSVLTVHIVKELDDVIALRQHNKERILEFCLDALEKDNVDKTIGYIISRDELYTFETAKVLIPKLAELYVLQGVVTVLQFFKSDVHHSTEMKRLFLREVMDLESYSDEGDGEAGDLPLSRRAVVEFKLEHEAEFMPLLSMRPPREFASATASSMDDSICLKLPLPESQVVMVDQDESLAVAYEVLMSQDVYRIGIDAEWRPDGRGYGPSRCSVLQIACDSHVFLFDLLELAISDLEELFAHLFSSNAIVKLGYALDGDIKRLQWSFPDVKCFDVVHNVLDFAHDYLLREKVALASATTDEDRERIQHEAKEAKNRRRVRGLSAFVLDTLGSPLNKSQQKSDWEKRPLTPQQIKYAALDAYCLLMLHDRVSLPVE